MKDISKIIEQYVYNHLSHRDDIKVSVTKERLRYKVYVEVTLKPTDGLYASINKGIDRQDLMNGLRGDLNLDWDNCMISYQVIDHSGHQYSTM
jgi:hypothetical protein